MNGRFCLFEGVLGVVLPSPIHAERANRLGLVVDGQEERAEQLTLLLLLRNDGDSGKISLVLEGHVLALGNGLLVDDGLQDGMESGKLGILLAVGHVLTTTHGHRELSAVHDELVLVAIGRDADVVGLADGQRACGDDIGLDGFLMTGLGDGLCTDTHGQHAK